MEESQVNNSAAEKTTIQFRSSGSGSHALLFIHGFLDAGAVWAPVIAHMTAEKFQKVTLDLPGMGALSADDGEISLERYATEVGAVLKQIGKRAVIIGQSMGAQIAELVAAANPDLVSGLVLVTPVPLGGVNAPVEAVQPFKNLGGQPDAQRQTRRNLSHALSRPNEEMLGRFGDAVRPSVVSALVDVWNNGVPAAGEQSRFAGPVMVIRGSADPFVTLEMANGVSARFRDVRIAVVESAGHWAHVEQAKAVASLLDDFLENLDWTTTPDRAADWKDAFAKRTASAFADAFADDVVLEATSLYTPVSGRENVKRVMEAASKIYESLDFTNQAANGPRQYVEWKARAFGGVELVGVTVITRDDAGAIRRLAIHHRPLHAALLFSTRLGERLRDAVDPSHFLAVADLPRSERS
jgi:pimeloyl-ACP methyl ester carboxylesterase